MNDRQLACARIDSKEGREYLNGMAAAANFAWVNRSSMTFLARQVKIRDCDCKCLIAYMASIEGLDDIISVSAYILGIC